jgi:hypothetical protein
MQLRHDESQIKETVGEIYPNDLKKLPTIREWEKFTKMFSLFRGASSVKSIEKWKIERRFGSSPTSRSAAEVGDFFSVHIQEGSRVAECEVIRLDELFFNKSPYFVPSRLGMCISNDEFHKLFNFTLAKRIAWCEDDPINNYGSELALSPVLNDTQNHVRQARHGRTSRLVRTPWTVDTRMISAISPETMTARTVHSIHLHHQYRLTTETNIICREEQSDLTIHSDPWHINEAALNPKPLIFMVMPHALCEVLNLLHDDLAKRVQQSPKRVKMRCFSIGTTITRLDHVRH